MAGFLTKQNRLFFITVCLLGVICSRSDCCFHRIILNALIPESFSQKHDTITPDRFPEELNSKWADISINTTNTVHIIDPRFLSLALDSHLIHVGWRAFDFNSNELKNLARALSPAIIRLGGTDADFLIFNSSANWGHTEQGQRSAEDSEYHKRDHRKNFTMTVLDWDHINRFAADVKWDVLFDLNMLLRNGTAWDPTNALAMLKYNSKRGYRIAGWELGNEPNHINHHSNITVPADQLGRDFITLRKLLDKNGYRDSFLVGPDVTHPIPESFNATDSILGKSSSKYLRKFLQYCGNSTAATTWHSYSLNGRNATADNFTDPLIMNGVRKEIYEVQKLVRKYRPFLPKIWLGETAGAYGGGAPGLSNAYAGGFLWLDKLGVSAASGLDLVIRQSFYSGNYGLLDKELTPTPVYWLSVLYKQLVGTVVLNVNVSVQDAVGHTTLNRTPTHVRAYAHCTNNNTRLGSAYNNGSITFFVINLQKSKDIGLSLTGHLSDKMIDQYLLTPHGGQNITATKVNLNGKKLLLTETKDIPTMKGKPLVPGKPVILPPLTYGFYVVNANASACQ